MKSKRKTGRLLTVLLIAMMVSVVVIALMGNVSAKSLYVNRDLNANSPIRSYDIQPAPTYLVHQMDSSPTRYGGVGLGIDTDSEILFITFEFSGQFDIVDAKTMNILGQVTAPYASDLAGVVVDQEKQKVYTVDRATNHLYVYSWDPATKTLTNDIATYPYYVTLPGIINGNWPGTTGIALDEWSDLLYVADYTTTVKYYHTAGWAQAGSFPVSHKAMGIAIDVNKAFVYTGSWSSSILSRYDLSTATETIKNIPSITGYSGDHILGLAVDRETHLVYGTTGGQGGYNSDLVIIFDHNLNFLYKTGDIGSPTGIVVPGKDIGFNPLNLDKTDGLADDAFVYPGDHITYTISYANTQNPFDVHNVVLTDTLPAEVTLVSATGGGSYDSGTHTYTWNIGTLLEDESGSVTLEVEVKSGTPGGTTIHNVVVIDSDQDPPTTRSEDTITYTQPPQANAGGPYSGVEGTPITFDASGSTDPEGDTLWYRWDFDGDGNWDTGYLTVPTATHTWGDDFSGTAKVEVTDGVQSDTSTAGVTVVNAPPVANAGSDQTVNEGAIVNFLGSFTDLGTADTHTVEWNFGDGNTASGLLNPTHTYGDNGVYTVTLKVTDDDSDYDTDTCTVTVNNVAPQATIVGGIGIADNYIIVARTDAQSYFIDILNDGSFASPELIDNKADHTWGAGIGDFDNDGDLDALIGDRWNTWYYEKIGDGNNFATAVSIDPTTRSYRMDFAEADFNNDGNLDAVMGDWNSNYCILYTGNGDGTFTISTLGGSTYFYGLDAADFNNDGNMDFIASAFYPSNAYVYLGNGDGTFQAPLKYTIGTSHGVCAGDFDNDGKVDIIYGESAMFYPGNGDGTFNTPISLGFTAYARAESDINGDGNLDIVYTDGSNVNYRTGNGDGTFSFVSTTPVVNGIYGIATSSDSGGGIIEVYEGDNAPFTGTFSDKGWLDTHTALWDWGDGSPTEIGTVTEENDEPMATGGVTGSHSYGDNGEYTITLIVSDDDSGSDSDTATVTVLNVPPVADAGADQTVDEGSVVNFDGSGTYDPGFLDELTYTWDFGDSSSPVSGVNLWNPQHIYGDNGVYTVTLTVDDDDGDTDTDTMTVTVNNVAPTITALNGPVDPVSLGSSVDITGEFTDPGWLDTHTATIDWGDSNVDDLGTVTSPIPQQTHTYAATGVYTVTLTVTDNDGGVDTEIFQYVVVYDPSDGFVTGGGWINSPAGAYAADPTLEGTANFGFVSKYKKGQQNPTGSTEFQYQIGNLNFHSNDYDWLVIAGAKAMYKGTGTINGAGNYGFMLSAIDEKLTPSTDDDMFRIKIWDKDNGDAVVYDNGLGDPDDADPTTAIAGGQIVIHKV